MKLLAVLMLAADLNGQPLPDVVLLDFGASYCSPCQQMEPVLQRMERDRFPVRKIDITEQPDISRKYRVDRIPTLIVLVKGKEAKRFVGLTAETELRQAMNEAARQLDARRKGASESPATTPAIASEKSSQNRPDDTAPLAASNSAKEPPKPGFRGLLDKVRRGFGGSDDAPAANNDPPDFRAQSPDESESSSQTSIPDAPLQATVRVRLTDGNMRDVGTGTIIHSVPGQSIILTCAHIFQKVSHKAVVEVDVFQDGKVLKYPAVVLGGDHESDVSLIQIKTTSPLTTVPIALQRPELSKSEQLFSLGCSDGDLPTRLDMNVIEVNRYLGPENILCTNDPTQGRSGGGLFDAQQQLVGVCSAADRKAKEGLYTGVKPIEKLISQLQLNHLLANRTPNFETAANNAQVTNSDASQFDDRDAVTATEDFSAVFDEAPVSDSPFSQETTAVSNTASDNWPAPNSSLPDPFQSAEPRTVMTSDTTTTGTPPEITVIIDSPDPAQGKRVIVIPNPSPWLLELLTGDKTAADERGLTTVPQAVMSATSSRQQTHR